MKLFRYTVRQQKIVETLLHIAESKSFQNLGYLHPRLLQQKFRIVLELWNLMTMDELLLLAQSVIRAIEPDAPFISDEILTNLNSIFPAKLVIAALDLIDRRNVIHYVTSWGHTEYEVLGSSEVGSNPNPENAISSYSVLLGIGLQPPSIPYSCSCPAFLHSVLKSRTHIMCKHILACLIARQMNLCITQPTTLDDLAALYARQFPSGILAPRTE